MRKSLWIILTVLFGAGAGTARASDITLDVSATFSPFYGGSACSGSGCTLGGDIVIDNSSSAIISADVTFAGESPIAGPFTTVLDPPSLDGALTYFGFENTVNGSYVILYFLTPTPGTLFGYTGGALNATSFVSAPAVAPPPPDSVWLLSSGALTEVGSTPEPTTVGLMLLGIGLLFVMRNRVAKGLERAS
jgi:hypothetical protein